jgi:hypothetical protein
MLAMLLAITSSLSCCALIPVAAMARDFTDPVLRWPCG